MNNLDRNMFTDLPYEIIENEITQYSHIKIILNLCETCKQYSNLCNNDTFWITMLKRDYNVEYSGCKAKDHYRKLYKFRKNTNIEESFVDQTTQMYSKTSYYSKWGHNQSHISHTVMSLLSRIGYKLVNKTWIFLPPLAKVYELKQLIYTNENMFVFFQMETNDNYIISVLREVLLDIFPSMFQILEDYGNYKHKFKILVNMKITKHYYELLNPRGNFELELENAKKNRAKYN